MTGLDLPTEMKLDNLDRVWQLLSTIQSAVANGELVEDYKCDEFAAQVSVLHLSKSGAWPGDFMHWNFFEPNTGNSYDLQLETYHGSGIIWRRII